MLKNPQAAEQKKAQSIVERVGELIVLPTEEEPTVATVSDSEKLKA